MAYCPDCGAALGDAETCNDLFNRMLALEWEVMAYLGGSVPPEKFLETPSGADGLNAHFYAVGTYQLQHPDRLEVAMIHGLRDEIGAMLAGTTTIAETRLRHRRQFDGPQRVRRRETGRDPALGPWPDRWPTTVADICVVAVEDYVGAVRRWAETSLYAIRAVRGKD